MSIFLRKAADCPPRPRRAGHQSGYERQRNSLIPTAEAVASLICGPEPEGGSEEWGQRWNAIFHTEMDRMWRERGAKP